MIYTPWAKLLCKVASLYIHPPLGKVCLGKVVREAAHLACVFSVDMAPYFAATLPNGCKSDAEFRSPDGALAAAMYHNVSWIRRIAYVSQRIAAYRIRIAGSDTMYRTCIVQKNLYRGMTVRF